MKGGGCLRRLLKEKRGEGFVDVCVLVLSVALVPVSYTHLTLPTTSRV